MGTHTTEFRIPAPPFVALVRPEWGKPRLKRCGANDYEKWVCSSSPYGEPIYAYAPDPLRAYHGWAQLAEWQAQDRYREESKRGWFRWRK